MSGSETKENPFTRALHIKQGVKNGALILNQKQYINIDIIQTENLNSPTTSGAYMKWCFSDMLRAFWEIKRSRSQDCTKRHINELEILIRNSPYTHSQYFGTDMLKHGDHKEFKSNVLLKAKREKESLASPFSIVLNTQARNLEAMESYHKGDSLEWKIAC